MAAPAPEKRELIRDTITTCVDVITQAHINLFEKDKTDLDVKANSQAQS
jgi:hypothetical protein